MKVRTTKSWLTGMVELLLVMLANTGCGNPSQRKLPKILEQTESLAILSLSDCNEPHFYPSNKFNWDRMWEGVTEGTAEGAEEVGEWSYFGAIISPVSVPARAIAGGVSSSGQTAKSLKSHFSTTLCNVFKKPEPGGRVSQRIHTNCKEKKPELQIQRVYWSDKQRTEYANAFSRKKKARMKAFCGTLHESGVEMLLVIHGVDYGLAGGTMENQASFFL